MRKVLAVAATALLPAFLATVLAAQTGSTTPSAPAKKPETKTPPAIVKLVGCIGGTGGVTDPFTLKNDKDGTAYRLTGTNMRAYKGQRVEIAGGPDVRRVKIVLGLTPSANVAAQAGTQDPAAAVVASDPLITAGKGDQSLPEFRVKTVRSIDRSCD